MVPLQYTQQHLEIFGFCPKEFSDNSFDIILFLKRFTISFICIAMALIPSIAYVCLHPDDTEALISNLIPIVGFILVGTSYLTFFPEGKIALKAFAFLRTIVNDRKFLP